jgi:hypothetical protein
MQTFLRLGINFGDIITLRIGLFSYDYRLQDRNSCLKAYQLNFIIHVPYLGPEDCITIIERLTSEVAITSHGEELYIDSGSAVANRILLGNCITVIMSHTIILDKVTVDTYHGINLIHSITNRNPIGVMEYDANDYHKPKGWCCIL